jgi:ligand-binding sensor domain-containing protein/signal transduction histidine kinase
MGLDVYVLHIGSSIRVGLILLSLASGTMCRSVAAPIDTSFFARAWQAEHGLPENKVVAVEQDVDGYLWVGTQVGLYRFDGMRFQEATAVNMAGVTSGLIRTMFRDPCGRVWVAKDRSALICLERGEIVQTLTQKDGLSAFQTRSMVMDKQGIVWLSDSRGMVFRVCKGKVEFCAPLTELLDSEPCLLSRDREGTIWFSQAGRVGMMRDGHRETRFTQGTTSALIQMARAGGLWIFAEQQLYHITETKEPQRVGERFPLRPGVIITTLLEDREQRLWVGTDPDGLFYLDKQGWHKVATSHPAILSISEDDEGNIWIGTQGGGLNRVRPRRLDVLGLSSGLPFDAVQSICEAADGTLWVVGQNNQLARRVHGEWDLLSPKSGWCAGLATCVSASADGSVYIGTMKKRLIRHADGVFATMSSTNRPFPAAISSLMTDSRGDLWFASGNEKKLFRFRDNSITTFEVAADVSLSVKALAEGNDGSVWAATTEGLLFHVQKDTLTDETAKNSFAPFPIRCLHVSDDGTLWIGYAGRGLGRIKDGRFLHVGVREGLLDNYVSQILSDDKGRLWLAGNRGLSYVAVKDFDALARGQAERVRAVAFGQGEGQPNLQATIGFGSNFVRCRDGRILMAMLTGLAMIHTDRATEPSSRLPVVIEGVTINGHKSAAYDAPTFFPSETLPKLINLRRCDSLPSAGPGVLQMEVDYTALSLMASDTLDFRYKLEGLDSNWVEAGHRRTAYFGALRPGDYRLDVQARTYDGEWNPSGAALSFTVLPFFWQTWWFQISCLVGLLAATGSTIRVFERRRNQQRIERLEHEHAVERERMRIAKDLHDEMGPELTGITLLSDLAQGADAPPDEIKSDVRKIGDMARGLSRSLSEIVWAVNPRNDSVESFVSYICHFAEEYLRPAGIRCLMDIPDTSLMHELSMDVRHNLFMVIKEALNNVVKHASATQVQIRFAMNAKSFRLTLEDNGCGFKSPDSASSDTGTHTTPKRPPGNGLENMRHRIESLGGRFTLQSAPHTGTRIELELDFVPSHTGSRVTPFAYLQQKMN